MKDDETNAGGVEAAVEMFDSFDMPMQREAPAPKPQVEQPDPTDEMLGAPLSPKPATAPVSEMDPEPARKPQDTQSIPDHVVRKGDKAIETWKGLHAEVDSAKARIIEIERDRELKDAKIAELEEAMKTAPKKEDIEAERKRALELEDTLGKIDVTKSKRFQELYDKPIASVFSKVVQQFMKAGRTQDQAVEKARRIFKPGMQDPRALSAELDDESSLVVGAVSALLDEREQLAQRREDALQNWRQEQAAEAEDRTRRDAASVSELLTKAATTGFDRALGEGSWLFREGEDPKWNAGVKARKDAVLGFMRGGKPEELAYLVAEGVAAPVYRKAYERAKAEVEDLRSQLASTGRLRPGVGDSRPQGQPQAAPSRPATLSEAVDNEWQD